MAKQQLPHVPDCLCTEFIEKTGEPCPSKSRSLKNRLIIALCVMVFCLCLMLFPRNADGGKAAEEPSCLPIFLPLTLPLHWAARAGTTAAFNPVCNMRESCTIGRASPRKRS